MSGGGQLAKSAEVEHVLDTSVRPAACSCGKAKYAGSPTFVRERHAVHVEDAAHPIPPGDPS